MEAPSRRTRPPVIAVAAGTFVMVTSEFLPIGLLSPMAADLGTSAGRTGPLVTVPGIVAAGAAPVGAVLAGNADRRRLLLWLSVLIFVSNGWIAVAGSFAELLIRIWTFEAAPEKFEAGSAVMVTVFQVALATGAFAGGIVVDEVGTPAAFFMGAALCLLCALAILAEGPARRSRTFGGA